MTIEMSAVDFAYRNQCSNGTVFVTTPKGDPMEQPNNHCDSFKQAVQDQSEKRDHLSKPTHRKVSQIIDDSSAYEEWLKQVTRLRAKEAIRPA
jgi:hypothetical protein